jgi:undecaprenyl-diphosphatase
LPISSDGHLVVAATFLGLGDQTLDVSDVIIVLHTGTLLSILVFYWRRIWELLRNDRRTIGLIVVATIPVVVIGLPIKLFAESWLEDPVLAGIFLVVTGLVLVAAQWAKPQNRSYRDLTIGEVLLLGLAQAAALLPGLSRSGCTIATGLHQGMAPQSAATFSFLIAIPAITGACTLEFFELWQRGGISTPLTTLLTGIAVSFVVGWGALWWLVRWLERGRFAWFAYWCIPVGVSIMAWQLAAR